MKQDVYFISSAEAGILDLQAEQLTAELNSRKRSQKMNRLARILKDLGIIRPGKVVFIGRGVTQRQVGLLVVVEQLPT